MLYDDLDKAQVPRDASPEVVRGALASLYRRTEGSVIHCNEPLKGARDHLLRRDKCHLKLGMINSADIPRAGKSAWA